MLCAERDLVVNIEHATSELRQKKDAVTLLRVKIDQAKTDLDRQITELTQFEKLLPALKDELEASMEKAVDSESGFEESHRAVRERLRKKVRDEINAEYGIHA